MKRIVAALDISCKYLADATMANTIVFLYARFLLENSYPWMHMIEAIDGMDEKLPRMHIALCSDYNILHDSMTGGY